MSSDASSVKMIDDLTRFHWTFCPKNVILAWIVIWMIQFTIFNRMMSTSTFKNTFQFKCKTWFFQGSVPRKETMNLLGSLWWPSVCHDHFSQEPYRYQDNLNTNTVSWMCQLFKLLSPRNWHIHSFMSPANSFLYGFKLYLY